MEKLRLEKPKNAEKKIDFVRNERCPNGNYK